MRIFIIFLLFFLSASMGNAVDKSYHKVAGAPVFLILPAGYEPADGFDGFFNLQTSGAITAVKLPDNLGVGGKALLTNAERFKEIMSQKNFRVLAHYDIKTDQGYDMRIYYGKQTGDDLIYDKWAGVSFNEKGGFVVTVQAMEGKGLPEKIIMALFKTAQFKQDNSDHGKLPIDHTMDTFQRTE